MKLLITLIIVAATLWFLMFSPLTAPYVPFWYAMTFSALVLSVSSSLAAPGWWRTVKWGNGNLLLGIVIAIALWGIFWLGDYFSQMLFGFARRQVDMIYGMKENFSPWVLSALLLFIIGPAEEIFWRGYVQKQLSARINPNFGWIMTILLYTLVHVSSCNFMLVMASMVCGVVWGTLYRFFPDRFAAIIFSHALWDAAVFVWFPI
ncbi:MAG: CPBP family intramembrane metalloprotease [Muribaculaceae bacterium]|nr:CPBP family intramembrane metalloprotease [Muribaculaceae bacterium]